MENFIELMAEILEVDRDTISLDTDFREDVDDFDSLKGFAILVMLEDEYDYQMDVDSFLECVTIANLYEKVS